MRYVISRMTNSAVIIMAQPYVVTLLTFISYLIINMSNKMRNTLDASLIVRYFQLLK